MNVAMNPSILTEVKSIRQHLHSIAEKSGEEKNTARFVLQALEKCNPSRILDRIGGDGIVATFDSGAEGKHLVLRCELDALPIQEVNNFSHKSKTEGVSHKCGHDGHMSILIGVAKVLANCPPKKGKVSLLFQPAEENGLGARSMIDSGKISELGTIDAFYALHNLPGCDANSIHCRAGVFTPHVISYEVRLLGKESHAAEPENGINPALAIADIFQLLHRHQQPDKSKPNYAIVVPVTGTISQPWYGISAGSATLGFTLRTWETPLLRKLQEQVDQAVKAIAAKYRLRAESRFFEEFYSVDNNADCARSIEKSARQLGLHFNAMSHPMSWGEDFGLFTDRYPGAMFGLGSGLNMPALHNPDYDFPDAIAKAGIEMFVELVSESTG